MSTPRPTLVVRTDGAATAVEIHPRAAAARLAIVILAGVWVALAVVWVVLAAATRAPLVFSAAVLPFLAIGIFVTARMLVAFPSGCLVRVDPARGIVVLPRGLLAGRPMAAALDSLGECRLVVTPGPGGLMRPEVAVEAGVRSIKVGGGLSHADLRVLLEALRAAIERARELPP